MMSAHVKGTGSFAYRTYDADLFDAPKSEPAKAADILDRMASERREWLRKIRAALAYLYLLREAKWGVVQAAYVTADDAQRLARTRPELALPAGASPNLFGAVFRTRAWVLIDRDHVSTTNGSHANRLGRWRYVGDRSNAA